MTALSDFIHREAEESHQTDLACTTRGHGDTVERVPLQRRPWDITDKFLPQPTVDDDYDEFEVWPDGDCRKIYRSVVAEAVVGERRASNARAAAGVAASKHSTGWAMRNTNNHNPLVLKKSCIGLLVCSSARCDGGVGIRPAICDKARAKQIGKRCPNPVCDGKLELRACRGNREYPVTHFWRADGASFYFLAKGEHDHPQPVSNWVARNTTTSSSNNTVASENFRKRVRNEPIRHELIGDDSPVVEMKKVKLEVVKPDPDHTTWTKIDYGFDQHHQPANDGTGCSVSWPLQSYGWLNFGGGVDYFDEGFQSARCKAPIITASTPYSSAYLDCRRELAYASTAIGDTSAQCNRKWYDPESAILSRDERSDGITTPPAMYSYVSTTIAVDQQEMMSYPSPPMPSFVHVNNQVALSPAVHQSDDLQYDNFYLPVETMTCGSSPQCSMVTSTTATLIEASTSDSPFGDVIGDGLEVMARLAGFGYIGMCT